MTKEERKAAYNKAYNEANKDKKKAQSKAWYEANKDKTKARAKAWREANKDKKKAQSKAWHEANRDMAIARAKAWREANIVKAKAYDKAYHEANKDKKKAYRKANRDRGAAQKKAWSKANKDRVNASNAKRRGMKLTATPVWADLAAILTIYTASRDKQDKTGKPHHVDHVIPLQGESVSGLHVSYNLRVTRARNNIVKSNGVDLAQLSADQHDFTLKLISSR